MRIKKRQKNMVRGVLVYLILTMGLWMFVYSYANSYNRLTDEKIPAAEFIMNENNAEIRAVGRKFNIDTGILAYESDFYFASYMLVPLELKLLCTVECAWEKEFGL